MILIYSGFVACILTHCTLSNTSQTGNSGDNQVNINIFLDGKFIKRLLKDMEEHPDPSASPSMTPSPPFGQPQGIAPTPCTGTTSCVHPPCTDAWSCVSPTPPCFIWQEGRA